VFGGLGDGFVGASGTGRGGRGGGAKRAKILEGNAISEEI
jgi:hypothetical protein